jgi:hypothetical protein
MVMYLLWAETMYFLCLFQKKGILLLCLDFALFHGTRLQFDEHLFGI